MNYDNGIPTSAILNAEELIGTTLVKWSEAGRILVYFAKDLKAQKPRPSEVYDYSKTALKGVLENLRASDGETTQSPFLGNGYRALFNIKFAERRRDLYNFTFLDGKIIPGSKYLCKEYEAKARTSAKHMACFVNVLPSFVEVDGTYRVHNDGRLEKIRDRTFESMKRYEFPVVTFIPEQATKKRKIDDKNSLPDYAKAA